MKMRLPLLLACLFACNFKGKNNQVVNNTIKEKTSTETSITSVLPTFSQQTIKVNTPKPYDSLTSPILVSGEAMGNWFFEGSFPVTLKSTEGEVITISHVTARDNWMQEGFVPFNTSLNFSIIDPILNAILVFQKDNPSGLAEHSDSIVIPVVLLKN